jgi:putative endonuclease
LVYFEHFFYIKDAIAREKQLKRWKRRWKIFLIEKTNAEWNDLAESIGVTDKILESAKASVPSN